MNQDSELLRLGRKVHEILSTVAELRAADGDCEAAYAHIQLTLADHSKFTLMVVAGEDLVAAIHQLAESKYRVLEARL